MGQVFGTHSIDPPFSPAPRDQLVGRCPTIEIQVNNKRVQCLVDTGSQVTLFSESLSKELFDGYRGQEAEVPWLILRGANGLDIPYIGYVVVDFHIQGVSVQQKGVVIVRDQCLGAHRALLGMNVISECWEELFRSRLILGPPSPEDRSGSVLSQIVGGFILLRPNGTERTLVGWPAGMLSLFRRRVRLSFGPGCQLAQIDQMTGSLWSRTGIARL